MNRLFISAACSLLLSACGLQPLHDSPPAPVSDRSEASTEAKRLWAQARLLRYRGRHGEALARLDQALKLQPADKALLEERRLSLDSWQRQKAQLRDRLLISEIQAARTQVPLLETLSRADPNDTRMRQRLDTARRSLAGAHAGLYRCGQQHLGHKPELARNCLELDLQLKEHSRSKTLLARLKSKRKKTAPRSSAAAKVSADQSPRTSPVIAKPAKPHPSVLKAEQLIEDGKYFGAIRQLSKLQQSGQADAYALQLLQQAQDQLRSVSLSMLQAGDEMLQQGRLREALALWEAVLNLDPYNQEARRKSELALRQLGDTPDNQEPDS